MMMMKGLSFLLCTAVTTTASFIPSCHPRQQRVLKSTEQVLAIPDAFSVQDAKAKLLQYLLAGEDENSPILRPYLDTLTESYASSGIDARVSEQPLFDGDWRNINTPAFKGRLGLTEDSRKLPIYTIGSLTFGLIPSVKHVECVVNKIVQRVHLSPSIPPSIPDALKETVHSNPERLRVNHIDTIFEIPDSRIKGILRMEGYTMPNHGEENRYDTWFVQGRCLAQDGVDTEEWNRVFCQGSLEYSLPKSPVAYHTVVFLDDVLRISIGSRGTVMINRRE